VDVAVAQQLAERAHDGERSRFGEPLTDHLARVERSVPPEARGVAWLHDLFEHSDVELEELRFCGLTVTELEALDLLTHAPPESYELHVLRIARAPGPAGRLARAVKLADLDDHLAHAAIPPDAPPYAWARRRIAASQARRGEGTPRPAARSG
jgi:hypothetical protein